MELTPEQLDAYLQILKEHGVTEFLGQGFHVVFTPPAPAPVVEDHRTPEPRQAEIRSMWESPELWPGGEPPTFHKRGK